MQSLGELLRALRRKQGMTQEQLAARAQVTSRTLQYWEANQQQPRDVELERILTALEANPQVRMQVYAHLTEQRSVRLLRSLEAGSDSLPDVGLGSEPPPGIGDLIRAMRLRHRWTQTQLAQQMQVTRATIIRWEATRTLPSDEDIARLCLYLNASPEEQTALKARRLSPVAWSPQLTLEDCIAQQERLEEIRSGNTVLMPLADLHTLALKRQLWFHLRYTSEAQRVLAKMEVQHSWWLYMQGYTHESCTANWRALDLVRGTFAPEAYWVRALNLLSAHAATSSQDPQSAVRLLNPWLRLLPSSLRLFVLCDMALYTGRTQQTEEANRLLQQAYLVLPDCPPEDIGEAETEKYRHWYHRMTSARVLLSAGKAHQALEKLPPLDQRGDGSVHELLIWAETSLAAGEKNAAARYLTEAQAYLTRMPLPLRQNKLDQLARLL